MIEHTRDAALVNALVGRDFPGCDMAELLANPLNVCLIEGDSGTLFAWRGPGIYEAHFFSRVRGRHALERARWAIDYMKERHGARMFWALVPMDSRKVRMFTRMVGWKPAGIFTTQHGPCEAFVSENVECLQS
jgi:hypothetical protein